MTSDVRRWATSMCAGLLLASRPGVAREPPGLRDVVSAGGVSFEVVRPLPDAESLVPLPVTVRVIGHDDRVAAVPRACIGTCAPDGGGIAVPLDGTPVSLRIPMQAGNDLVTLAVGDAVTMGNGPGHPNRHVVAWAGPDARELVIPTSSDTGGCEFTLVDVGTWIEDHPDDMHAWPAVILEDGWAPPALRDVVVAYVRRGGILSVDDATAHAFGLTDVVSAQAPIPLEADLPTAAVVSGRPTRLSTEGTASYALGAGRVQIRRTGLGGDALLGSAIAGKPALARGWAPSMGRLQLPVYGAMSAAFTRPTAGLMMQLSGVFVVAIALGAVMLRRGRTGAPRPIVGRLVAGCGAISVVLLARNAVSTDPRAGHFEEWSAGDGRRDVIGATGRTASGNPEGLALDTPAPVLWAWSVVPGGPRFDDDDAALVQAPQDGRTHVSTVAPARAFVAVWRTIDTTPGALFVSSTSIDNKLPDDLDGVLWVHAGVERWSGPLPAGHSVDVEAVATRETDAPLPLPPAQERLLRQVVASAQTRVRDGDAVVVGLLHRGERVIAVGGTR